MAAQAWGQLGMQVAGNTANTALGMLAQRIGANYDRKQQLKTQEAMMKLQYPWQLRMMQDQKNLDYDMWEKTGIVGQMTQLEKAGMNAALLYGGGGGGGQTVGGTASMNAPSAGIISTGNPQGLGMTPMTGAQIRLMDAQARNLDANTEKTAGVDTQNVQSDTLVKNQTIENLKQSVRSEQAKQKLTEIQTQLGKNQNQWEQATMQDRINITTSNATEAAGIARTAEANGEISHQTYLDVIAGIRVDVANKLITGKLLEAQVDNTKQSTAESKERVKMMEAQINEIAESIQYNWEKTWQGRDANDIAKERNRITEELGKLGISAAAAGSIMDNLQQWADRQDQKFKLGKYRESTQGRDQYKGGASNGGRNRGGAPGGLR